MGVKESFHASGTLKYFDYSRIYTHLLDGDLKVQDEFLIKKPTAPETDPTRLYNSLTRAAALLAHAVQTGIANSTEQESLLEQIASQLHMLPFRKIPNLPELSRPIQQQVRKITLCYTFATGQC